MPTISTDSKEIFVSYSRVDVAYARQLTETLSDLGFSLWRDRSDMEGGENWWQQIEEAIRGVDTMLLLLSEAALASKIVSKEWRYARQVGTRVIPVIADTFAADRAPRWMSKRDWYDFRRRDQDPDQQVLWDKLLTQLRTPYQRQRVPFMAEDLPADYVPRSTALNQITSNFIDDIREEPRAVTLALKGAGGFGKTTLARAVCADERIQAAFDDGILWVTFGEKVENLTGKVDDLVYTLTGKHSNANTLETVTAELVNALAERDILLVLDDVWDAAHLKPFLQGGTRCARLITTRDAATLPPGTQKINIDEMSRPEAVTLLRRGLPAGEEAAFERLAQRLGYWPLLLKLVNGALRDTVLDFHQPLLDALNDMNQGLDEGGLTVFDLDNTTDRSKAVRMTIELSLSRLSAEEKGRFEQLVIFPEDINIPLEIVGRLWGISGVFTRRLCGRLFNMSLLVEYNLETGTLRLHDIVRDYLKQSAQQDEVALHNKLLDSYQLENWSELPESDRYMWEYLTWHMGESGQKDQFAQTMGNINFLAKKSILVNSHSIENDMYLLAAVIGDELYSNSILDLSSQFARIAHLLNRCQTVQDAVGVIWNRIFLSDNLGILFGQNWFEALNRSILSAERPLPDIPASAIYRTLDGHRDSVKAISFSPKSDLLVSHGDDRTLRLWDAFTGESKREPLKVLSEGRGVAWSHDGSFIAAVFKNGEAAIYDPTAWVQRLRWVAHDYQARGVAISPDSQHIATVGRDWRLKIWDRDGNLIRTHAEHAGSIEGVAYSTNGVLLASCDQNGLVLVWDAQTGAELYRIQLQNGKAYSVAFSHDDRLLAVGCNAGKVLIRNLETSEQQILHAQSGDVRGVAFRPKGMYFVSGSSDRSIILWRVQNWVVRDRWQDHLGIVRALTWSPDSLYVASGSSDRLVKLWDWSKGIFNQEASSEQVNILTGTFYSLAYLADGRLITLEKSGRVFAIDPQGEQEPQPLTGFRNDSKVIACSPSGNWILGTNGTESVKRWEARTNKRSGFLVAELGAKIFTANYSPDEHTIVTTTGSNVLQLRAAHNLELQRSWAAPDGVIFRQASYSPDGKTIVAPTEDGTIWLWQPDTDTTQTLTGHTASVNGAAYSPDGLYIASVSSDRTLKVWEVATLRCVHTFYADGGLYSLTWHPDSAHLVAAGARGLYWLAWVRS
jgi:WD40 repeat protein